MSETKDPPVPPFERTMGVGVGQRQPLQQYDLTMHLMRRTSALWTFAARRAAFEDISDQFAALDRTRVAAAAIYVNVPESADDEASIAGVVRQTLQRVLANHGFSVLAINTLPKGVLRRDPLR